MIFQTKWLKEEHNTDVVEKTTSKKAASKALPKKLQKRETQ